MLCDKAFNFRRRFGLNGRDDYIFSTLPPAQSLGKHLDRFADAGRVAQENLPASSFLASLPFLDMFEQPLWVPPELYIHIPILN